MVVPLTLGDKCHVDHHIILDGTLQRTTTTHSSDFLSRLLTLSFSLSVERDDGENSECFFLRDKTSDISELANINNTVGDGVTKKERNKKKEYRGMMENERREETEGRTERNDKETLISAHWLSQKFHFSRIMSC